MYRILVSAMAVSTIGTHAQPTYCSEEPHCPTGFYCVPNLHYCQPCLSCDTFKRETPVTKTPCITSITACGKCLEGYVLDAAGDFCVTPDEYEQSSYLPWYIWLVIASITIILVTFPVLLYIFLRRRKIDQRRLIIDNKFGDPNIPVQPPSAPPEPAQPLRPVPNYQAPLPPYSEPCPSYNEESEMPLVKCDSARWPNSRSLQRDSNQATKPYTTPNWVRHSPLVNDNNNAHESQYAEEVVEDQRIREPEDEETIPSPWTPHSDVNANNEAASGSNGEYNIAGGAEAADSGTNALRRTSLTEHSQPPAKVMRGDSNNNSNHEASEGGTRDESGRHPNGGTNFFINVINTVGSNTYQHYHPK